MLGGMKPVILYVACSLDGYLADAEGGIGFLEACTVPMADLGYDAFYDSIGTLIMGGKTYRQVANELSPDQWPYAGKPCYVYSRTETGANDKVAFTALPPKELLAEIRRDGPEGAIWLMGGGEIIRVFLQDGLIDEYRLYLMPTLLGAGIPVFPRDYPQTSLALKSAKDIQGIVELIYTRK